MKVNVEFVPCIRAEPKRRLKSEGVLAAPEKQRNPLILYQLTMYCDSERCELDFVAEMIIGADSKWVYLKDRKISRENLGKVCSRYSLNKVLLTAFFMPKEAVLVIVRQMCLFIYVNCTNLFEAVKAEWAKIRLPQYDERWFLGNEKANEWEKEFGQQIWEPLGIQIRK